MATILNTTQQYNAADVVTHTNLNQIVGGTTFVAGDGGATDNVSLEVDSGTGSLQVKNGGITKEKIESATLTEIYDSIYPVGSIYSNATDGTNPGTLLGFGTWAPFGAGKVPVGIDTTDDDFDVVGSGTNTNSTTGAKTHTLDVTEIPPHKHGVQIEKASGQVDYGTGTGVRPPLQNRDTTEVGGGLAHNNLQPYIVVYMWTRTN